MAFFSHWTTRTHWLTDATIVRALKGQAEIGYFTTTVTVTLGLDLDDHSTGPTAEISAHLRAKYARLVRSLGLPSAAYKSPQGMHCYYYLFSFHPAEFLSNWAHEKVGGFAEVKPTAREALRIPELSKALDPESLVPSPAAPFQAADRDAWGMFGGCALHGYYRQEREPANGKGGSANKSSLAVRGGFALAKLEEKLTPLENGRSNLQYKALAAAYFRNGLCLAEAEFRLRAVLVASPGYTGELRRNPRRLTERLKSSYRNLPLKGYADLHVPLVPVTLGFYTLDLIERLVTASPFQRQARPRLREYITGILRWKAYQDQVLADPHALAAMDAIYRYYRKNRKAGLYPLPRSLMRLWGGAHYNKRLAWFKEIGFLVESEVGYSDLLGVCKYYRIAETPQLDATEPVERLRQAVACESQVKVAARLGVTQHAISQIISGKRLPREALRRRLKAL